MTKSKMATEGFFFETTMLLKSQVFFNLQAAATLQWSFTFSSVPSSFLLGVLLRYVLNVTTAKLKYSFIVSL